ncbi:signal peptide peptidase SppA [Rhodothermus profundi]|uniref:Signal peptide peptidase A. Serine peptidase. MEROPS family S49 n=1 Tax=Rhodothermus profundi TaxID=633813 RepID=A0A1M6TGY6_9BACT|nr:signal peptide peptidase SppA [Rhodothermus profundi]SHK56237.1 signal peptide peptidase A. Serine peptidase. MEROPS family S49 [Rhodothermus profundi]
MRFLSTLLASILGTLIAIGLLFLFTFLFLAGLASLVEQPPTVRSGSVLVIRLSGSIPEVVSHDPLNRLLLEEPPYGLRDLTHALKKAAADQRIEAVWLRLQSPQLSWATLEEIRAALVDFKSSGKLLIASCEDFGMDEATYFLASAADSVFAGPESFFEFNGFYLTATFYKRLLDWLDVEAQVVRAGAFKSAGEPFVREHLSEENRLQLQALLNTYNRRFLETVAQARGLSIEALDRLATEQVLLTAEEAVQAGLLDGLRDAGQIQQMLKAHLGYEPDETLRRISLRQYVRVPDRAAGLPVGNEGEIAVIYAVGTIIPGKSQQQPVPLPLFGNQLLGSETLIAALEEARQSDRVKAVVLRINSPGGSAAASEAMWQAIRRTADEKPVIVSMGDVAASGGYWISTAADTIVADPLTITGSIGVIGIFFNAGGLLENKLGITFDLLRTSPYADMFSGLVPPEPYEVERLQQTIMATYRAFLDRVAQARGLPVDSVDAVGGGRVWIGETAHRIGLVDVLGGLDRAIAIAAEKAGLAPGTYRIRVLPRPKTFAEQLAEQLEARVRQAWLHLTGSPTTRWLAAHRPTLEMLRQLHGTPLARMWPDVSIR